GRRWRCPPRWCARRSKGAAPPPSPPRNGLRRRGERVKKFGNRVGDVLQRPDVSHRRNPFSRFLHTLGAGARSGRAIVNRRFYFSDNSPSLAKLRLQPTSE